MNDEQFTIELNGVEYRAVWFDKEDDRRAEWYILRNGTKIGTFAGYPANRPQVENFIRSYIAK